ncbi:MAG: hypothetical protein KGM16_06310 [Bacteroidota bacterium]|nr:hypothetical protein [Bacteroidota bacterium]
MKKIQIFFAASICFSTATIAQTNASLKLPTGKTYQVENKLETSSSTDVQGQTMESKANITSTYKIDVKNKTGENYNLTNTLSHINMSMSMMGQDINFDSDSTSDMKGEFGSALKDYVNQPKDLTINNSSKIVSADSTDTSATGIAKRLNLAQTGYGTQLAFLPLPENPKVGTSWTENTNSDGMSRTTNYTIKDISGDIATIAFTGTDSVQTTMEQQGMEIATKTTGKVVGEEKVDIKTGVIQSGSSTGDASGTVSAMGQDFPMKTKITSTTTVKEL